MICPSRNVFLDAMLAEMRDHREEDVLMDRVHDRDFCRMVGLDYTDSAVFTRLRELILNYKVFYGSDSYEAGFKK